MATRILQYKVSTPLNVFQANPKITVVQFSPALVTRIEVVIPPGPQGQLGFHIDNGNGQFVPQGAGNWINLDDTTLTWDLIDSPDNGNWQIVTYNSGFYPHSISVFFHLEDIVLTQPTAFSPLVSI